MAEPREYPESYTEAEREAYARGYCDGSATADEIFSRVQEDCRKADDQGMGDLVASLRECTKYLVTPEALKDFDQLGRNLAAVMTDIALERHAQGVRWGERHLPPEIWLVEVMEGAGNVAVTTFNSRLIPGPKGQPHRTPHYERVILLAATCVAWAEQLRLNPPGYLWNQQGTFSGEDSA